jgi:hypothetical protein
VHLDFLIRCSKTEHGLSVVCQTKFEVSPIRYHDGVFLMYCIIMYVGLSNNASVLFSFSFFYEME